MTSWCADVTPVTRSPAPAEWSRPIHRVIRSTIAVRFPGQKDEPLKIKHFASALAGFKHRFGDLNATFEELELVGDSIEVKVCGPS